MSLRLFDHARVRTGPNRGARVMLVEAADGEEVIAPDGSVYVSPERGRHYVVTPDERTTLLVDSTDGERRERRYAVYAETELEKVKA